MARYGKKASQKVQRAMRERREDAEEVQKKIAFRLLAEAD